MATIPVEGLSSLMKFNADTSGFCIPDSGAAVAYTGNGAVPFLMGTLNHLSKDVTVTVRADSTRRASLPD